MLDMLIDFTLLAFIAMTSIAILRMNNMFAFIILFGIFCLISAGVFVVLVAADFALK